MNAFIEGVKLIGGIGGLLSAAFLLYDRIFRWRPLVYLHPEDFQVKLRIVNVARETIIIDKIKTPPMIAVIWDSDLRAAAAVIEPSVREEVNESRPLVIGPSEERSVGLMPGFNAVSPAPEARLSIRCDWRNTRRPLPFRRSVHVRTNRRDFETLRNAGQKRN